MHEQMRRSNLSAMRWLNQSAAGSTCCSGSGSGSGRRGSSSSSGSEPRPEPLAVTVTGPAILHDLDIACNAAAGGSNVVSEVTSAPYIIVIMAVGGASCFGGARF